MSDSNGVSSSYRYSRCDGNGNGNGCDHVMRAIKDAQGMLSDLTSDVKQVVNIVVRMDEQIKNLHANVNTLDTIVRGSPTSLDASMSTRVSVLRSDVDYLKKQESEILSHKRHADVTIKVAVVTAFVSLVGIAVQVVLHFIGSK